MSTSASDVGNDTPSGQPKLLFLVTEDWFFLSHFFDRALAAKRAGFSVVVVARDTGHRERIEDAGLAFRPLPFGRGSVNPMREWRTFRSIFRAYLEIKPAIVHHVAIKPIIYGSVAALFAKVPAIVNAPVGMGFLFASRSAKARILRPVVSLVLGRLINPRRSRVVFENGDDRNQFVAAGAVKKSDAVIIRGAGVDLDMFQAQRRPVRTPVVTLVARLLWDKGVGEFVEAARLLRSKGVKATFRLIGAPDAENPASIPEATLRDWVSKGLVEWPGWSFDIPSVLAQSDIAALPSYREGLPKALLEAMAAGLPVVATDVPGCREVVADGINGLLVPPRNASALAVAIEKLVGDPTLRSQYGKAGRQRAVREFSSSIIVEQTLELYADLMRGLELGASSRHERVTSSEH
jgi:glycosyltransferase involved in cell wall biosynthesis